MSRQNRPIAYLADDGQVIFDSTAIRIVKKVPIGAIIPDKRTVLLKHINDIETEMGRMARLIRDVRAEILSLTLE